MALNLGQIFLRLGNLGLEYLEKQKPEVVPSSAGKSANMYNVEPSDISRYGFEVLEYSTLSIFLAHHDTSNELHGTESSFRN